MIFQESNNFGSRFFNSKTSPQKETENTENKPKSIKKTTILAREHHAEDRSASPKGSLKDNESTSSISITTSPHNDCEYFFLIFRFI